MNENGTITQKPALLSSCLLTRIACIINPGLIFDDQLEKSSPFTKHHLLWEKRLTIY